MPTINADGCPIHVEVEGPENAPVLMLSNSLGTTLAMWEPQVAPFTQHFRLVRFDRRGPRSVDTEKESELLMSSIAMDAAADDDDDDEEEATTEPSTIEACVSSSLESSPSSMMTG